MSRLIKRLIAMLRRLFGLPPAPTTQAPPPVKAGPPPVDPT